MVGLLAAPTRAVADEPPDLGKLNTEMMAAYQAGNFQKALEIGEKIHEAAPENVDTIYNIACLHCLLGHKDKAYEWLEDAIDAGYDDADHLMQDDDFKSIRAEDRFRAIVKDLREGDKKQDDKAAKEKKESKKEEDAKKKDEAKKDDQPKKEREQEKKAAKEEQEEKQDKEPKAKKPGKQTRFQLTPAEIQQKIGELTQECIKASEEKEHFKALSLALEARVLADVGLTNYNVACMYSILGKKNEAFRYLDRAIDLGGVNGDMVKQIEDDKDFDKIRKDPRYAELLEKAGKGAKGVGALPQGKEVKPEWQVTVPKGFDKDKKAPLIVALHAYNDSMEGSIEHWKAAAAEIGAILLTPQGAYQLDNDHYQWGRDLNAIEEIVMDSIDEVIDEYKVDKKKVVVVGFSQGAWAAWALALRNPDVFCGAIPVGGRFPQGWKDDAEEDLVKNLRVFAMLGAKDDENLVTSNKDGAKDLAEIGAKVEVKVYDGIRHEFPKKATEEEVKALEFVLGK
jgi:predicted esterase